MAHVTSLLPAAAPATPDSLGLKLREAGAGLLEALSCVALQVLVLRGDRKPPWFALYFQLLPTVILPTPPRSLPETAHPTPHLSLQGDFVTLQVLPG